MFYKSCFNQDISKWNIPHLEDTSSMFMYSAFNHDLSDWNTSNIKKINQMFTESFCQIPYWYTQNIAQRCLMILQYQQQKEQNLILSNINIHEIHKKKIIKL